LIFSLADTSNPQTRIFKIKSPKFMPSKKPTEKSTKAEILQAYEEIAKEKSALKSELDQALKTPHPVAVKEKPPSEPKTPMNQTTSIQQKMNSTIENLVKIQLGFGSAASELSEQLTTKASKLAEIKQSVNTEVQQLQELHKLEISPETLDTLIEAYENNSKAYQEEFNQRYETLSQETQQQRSSWQKQQDEYKLSLKERNETLAKSRQREDISYKYDLELQRKLESDEYEQRQKTLYKEIEEIQQETEKKWTEREKVIAEREQQFAELKAKVEAFPKDKEAAIKKASEEGKGIAHYQAKIKSDLLNKEVEGQKRFYEQRLQSLEQTINNQESRIQNLSNQLDSALKQVQDLAVKAIEGSANVNSYQAIKEIALEQAKSQAKAK
jgi:DNA repair exonuclease SbcCD ATPase subunit